MAGSTTEFTKFVAAGPLNLELKFGMTAPTPVESSQEEPSETETVAGDEDDVRAGTPFKSIQGARSQSGIKLRVSFKKNTIKVVNPKKRAAAQLEEGTLDELRATLVEKTAISAARIAGYTKEELDVAMTLAGKSFLSLE
jgi:hypothetical protein